MASRVQAHLEDLLVDADRGPRVAELLVAELRLLEQEVLALRIGVRGLGAPLDHLQQRGVIAGLLVERLEGDQRPPVVAAELERLRVVLLREIGLSEGRARGLGDPERHLQLQVAVDDVRGHRPEQIRRAPRACPWRPRAARLARSTAGAPGRRPPRAGRATHRTVRAGRRGGAPLRPSPPERSWSACPRSSPRSPPRSRGREAASREGRRPRRADAGSRRPRGGPSSSLSIASSAARQRSCDGSISSAWR